MPTATPQRADSRTLFDVAVLGGGAAGLFAAAQAASGGARVVVIDHAEVLGEKIRISGGGRCNFTNLHCAPEHFLSHDPKFVRHALAAYPPQAFVEKLKLRGIAFHEKHRGQLFCSHSAQDIVSMLLDDCARSGVLLVHPAAMHACEPPRRAETEGQLAPAVLDTSRGQFQANALIVATGGLPVPKIGATAWALDFARRLGLKVIEPRPALVPLSLTDPASEPLRALSGLSLPARVGSASAQGYGAHAFNEDLLLTHKGLSGPAVLQASSFWEEGGDITIDWVAESALSESEAGGRDVMQIFEANLPARLAAALLQNVPEPLRHRRWAELGRNDRLTVRDVLRGVRLKPAGTLGWNKAEVMRGGVATAELSPKTCEVRRLPGLYFIGECVDVTGHLGGHNFQWAWASGHLAGVHAARAAKARPASIEAVH